MSYLNQIKIIDIYEVDLEPPVVVSQEEEFTEVVRLLAAFSEIPGTLEADHHDQFSAVISRSDLLDWARVQATHIIEEGELSSDKFIHFSNNSHVASVGEVMDPISEMAAVKFENTIKDAMRKMVELDLIVLPVVDDANQLIGTIKLLDIFAASLEDNNFSQ